ncbi:hypothetical protein DFH09DRAFT_1355610 [Mycena vulgaris]|nr:hypothetical protein DFH09DRAFT_1355610 [Mycena vulgaris]
MPPSSSDSKVLDYTRTAANILEGVSDAINVPLLKAVSAGTMPVVSMVQDVRTNKDRCLRMVDLIHQLLCVITLLTTTSGSVTDPKFIDNVGRLAQNLNKFHACLRSQQELGTIRRLFKQSEIIAQLEACEVELQGLLELFKLYSGGINTAAMAGLNAQVEQRHQEFLELLASGSNSQYSDTASGIEGVSHGSGSSEALSLVPASPHIFHGRDSELGEIVAALMKEEARVAIMGSGGMGKTTLVLAALHHADVEEKYPQHHFVSCESANSAAELILIVGSYLQLPQSKGLSKAIYGHFLEGGPAILVLDNMETPWESLATRPQVEEFLSLLADVPHLALLVNIPSSHSGTTDTPQITMRGAERPGRVKWTRPFLSQLEPISTQAVRQTFIDIAEEPAAGDEAALEELIELTGNLPLAVVLLANVVSFEGYLGALARWKTENTALLSDGYDKRSSLEKSISTSLTSPRMKSNPHALDLLRLLSLLPDGISEDELVSSKVPLPKIAQCISSLRQTSLAFMLDRRVKALAPVRDYIRWAYPASAVFTQSLLQHFQALLQVWGSYEEVVLPQLASHLGNISSLLLNSLVSEGFADPEVGHSILTLSRFSVIMLKGHSSLLEYLPSIIESTHDEHLKWTYIRVCVGATSVRSPPEDAENLGSQGVRYFAQHNDYASLALTYQVLADYYGKAGDIKRWYEFGEHGMELATKINHPVYQMRGLQLRGVFAGRRGASDESIRHYREAQKLARLHGSVRAECENLTSEAGALCTLGNFAAAQACLAEGYKLLMKKGFEGSQVELGQLSVRSRIHQCKTEYAEARQLTERMAQMTSRHRSPYYHAWCLITLVQLDLLLGLDGPAILENFAAARELATEIRFSQVMQMCDFFQAELDLRNGHRTKAYTTLKILGGRTQLLSSATRLSLEKLGELSNHLCQLERTFHWATTYFALSRKTKELGGTYQALRYLGDILLAQGDEQTAMNIFHAVLDASTEMDVHRRRADCMSRIGDILVRRGELEKAKDMWEAALPLFVRSSQAKDATAIESKLSELARGDLGALEELDSKEEATAEIPTELFNLRAPIGQAVTEPEAGG